MLSAINLGISKLDEVFIIAEAGVNHNGSLENAMKLIDMAKKCGANAIKFQKKHLFHGKTVYAGEKKTKPKNLLEQDTFQEFSQEKFKQLQTYAKKKGIIFCASAWDESSADFLVDLGIPFLKIGSHDLTNFPLLEHVAKKKIPLVISTGMADLDTVREAYEIVSMHNQQVALLQCTSCYPTRNSDINLNIIKTYQKEFTKCVIGYSGHEKGHIASLGAVALGAKIIERHITLNKNMEGPEHIASLEEQELSNLVSQIREMELCLGSTDKKRLDCEKTTFQTRSKSLVLAQNVKKGEVILRCHLTTRSPAAGISPTQIYYVLGRKFNSDLAKGSVLLEEYIR
jgi:sialic acid synthase SpsE